jgi:hypothetical protein
MPRFIACLALLFFSSTAFCDGLSVDGLVLGGNIYSPPLTKLVPRPTDEQRKERYWGAHVPVTYLGNQVSAFVVVNNDGRIHNIDIRLPLGKLDDVRRNISQLLGEPMSDKEGWVIWERRDMETAAGLRADPKSGTLLLSLIWASYRDPKSIATPRVR